MSDRGRLTYEQAWSTISEVAKACRDFNELQFKYRQLAITLILAAYAAIGFFLTSADPAVKAAQEVQATQAVVAAQSGTPAAAPAQAAPFQEPKPSPTHVRRVSLLILGIGLLASIAILLIWLIDIRLYHRLLQAFFWCAHSFEHELESSGRTNWPPFVHHEMYSRIEKTSSVFWISFFYLIAAVAGIVPWCIYVYLNAGVTNGPETNVHYAMGVLAAVTGMGTALFVSILRSTVEREVETPALPPVPAAPAPAPATAIASLVSAAREARLNARAPYSHFAVGAAVLAANGTGTEVFAGCNVENAAYGSTMCAERNALAAAVAAGFNDVREIVVYTEAGVLTTPCGACRQVMQELAPDARVHLASGAGVQRVLSVPELFPHAFGAASLKA